MQQDRVHEINIRLSHKTQNIPYRSGRSEESETFPYISLLEDPSRIDEIPELRESPVLYNAIRSLNLSEGVFETFRVVFWRDEPNENHEEQVERDLFSHWFAWAKAEGLVVTSTQTEQGIMVLTSNDQWVSFSGVMLENPLPIV